VTRLLVLTAAFIATPALAQKVDPGEWQITSTVSGAMFPKPETRTEAHCMKQGEVDDPNRWLGQMGADCTVTPTKQGADHYSWTVACPKNGVRGSGNMRWTRTTMDIEMDLASEKDGKKVEMRSKVSGRRVGPCKG
jgi:hypothetical protein